MADKTLRSAYMKRYREWKKQQQSNEAEFEVLHVNNLTCNFIEGEEENASSHEASDEHLNDIDQVNNIENNNLESDEAESNGSDVHEGGDAIFLYSDESSQSSDSDSDNDETFVSNEQQEKTREFLRMWAIKRNPTVNTLTELLHHLNTFMPSIPKSVSTLKETVGKIDVIEKCGGQYYYLSMKEALDLYLRNHPNMTVANILINIDGAQAYKSKNSSFWPILATVNDTGPYIVCIWYGSGKPSSVDTYLEDFINEMKLLLKDGHRNLEVKLLAFICDAPARDFLKCIASYNSYNGCERCKVHGIYNRGVRLLETNAPPRTNEEFALGQYVTHQHQVSPLVELGFPMMSGFILDSMHLVFLGVCKKLLVNWISGRNGTTFSTAVKLDISAQLERMAPFVPSVFQRTTRSLDSIAKWKAVEYRFFILYAGPIVLKGNVSNDEYDMFNILSVAMHILLCDSYCQDRSKVLYANDLLLRFVETCIRVYGDGFVTYNIHSLIHISDDVLNHHRSLNLLSAFKYESYLGLIVKDVRGTKYPTHQAVKRYKERCLLPTPFVVRPKSKNVFHRLPNKRNAVFSLNNNRFAVVHQLNDEKTVLCKIIRTGSEFYNIPLVSTDLGFCYKSTIANCNIIAIKKENLNKQAMMLPVIDGGFVFTPLLHTTN